MTYEHKKYTRGFKCSTGILNEKHQILTVRYRGQGRPRNSDYNHKTTLQLIKEANELYNLKLDKALKDEIFK